MLRPAEDTPTSATILARLALEAGMPPGVFNVVHGYGPDSAGQALTENPDVDRITFTGESGTGRIIARAGVQNLIPASLELGGKGANVVFADADLDNAVHWAVRAIFTNAGQVCLAGSRLFVQREIFDEFLDLFVEVTEALVIGDPKRDTTEFGPLASEEHFNKVRAYVDSVELQGGKIRTGGVGEGWLVRPTIVTDLPVSAPHCREEIFGPLVTVTPLRHRGRSGGARQRHSLWPERDAVHREPQSGASRVCRTEGRHGMGDCFFIRDLRAPFGGVGDSGMGREGGNFSREFFTEPKAVVMQLTP